MVGDVGQLVRALPHRLLELVHFADVCRAKRRTWILDASTIKSQRVCFIPTLMVARNPLLIFDEYLMGYSRSSFPIPAKTAPTAAAAIAPVISWLIRPSSERITMIGTRTVNPRY